MELIDTHAHLTCRELAGRIEDVLDAARAAGVGQIISVGSDAADSAAALGLAERFDGVFASAGIHPHEAGKVSKGDFERVAALWREKKVVAVGEIGLDYHYDFAEWSVQRQVLEEQLSRAREHDLPLIIHCREAFDDCIRILENHGYAGRRVVFHCFTGEPIEAEGVAARGWRISFTGIVTFRKLTELQEIARAYPADEVMIETDSPYLSPEPVRHVRPNEPAHVAHTARFLAKLRGTTEEELAAQTTRNARAFFGLA